VFFAEAEEKEEEEKEEGKKEEEKDCFFVLVSICPNVLSNKKKKGRKKIENR